MRTRQAAAALRARHRGQRGRVSLQAPPQRSLADCTPPGTGSVSCLQLLPAPDALLCPLLLALQQRDAFSAEDAASRARLSSIHKASKGQQGFGLRPVRCQQALHDDQSQPAYKCNSKLQSDPSKNLPVHQEWRNLNNITLVVKHAMQQTMLCTILCEWEWNQVQREGAAMTLRMPTYLQRVEQQLLLYVLPL